jgi:L-seryl-tRNA(Ser) seleniumtransferase
MDSEFRQLPSVDKLLSEERISRLKESFPHGVLVGLIRRQLEQERAVIAGGGAPCSLEELVASVCAQVEALSRPRLRPVINATGVILHTNLGRAPLSQEATAAMSAVAAGYSNLELDLASAKRGSRQSHIEHLLCQLTGAEAALVVNNNAAAVLLGLTTLAKRKEVIVSRGQAVEIGGGFRIPDVMRQSGAKLIEVGTTNCTYITDYEQALSPRTVALMRVHSSNFKLVGFIHDISLEEIVSLARQHDRLTLDDLGSGCLLDTTRFGLDPEPTMPQSIALGADLVFASGDKLLGGPQAGIIVGKERLVSRLAKHPLARAMRIDKIRLAGLATTLIHYLKGEAMAKIPVWQMISTPLAEVERRAKRWSQPLGTLARVVDGETMVGGGSLPGSTLASKLVAVGEGGQKKHQSLVPAIAERLRAREIPVLGRISDNVLFLDPRSVLPEDDEGVLQALRQVASELEHSR